LPGEEEGDEGVKVSSLNPAGSAGLLGAEEEMPPVDFNPVQVPVLAPAPPPMPAGIVMLMSAICFLLLYPTLITLLDMFYLTYFLIHPTDVSLYTLLMYLTDVFDNPSLCMDKNKQFGFLCYRC
jgi:hypothetical protein